MIMEGGQEEWKTVQVSNVPLETTRWELEQLFSEYGPIKKCFTVKPRDDKSSSLAFVTFSVPSDCKSVLESKDDLAIGENKLKLKLAPDNKRFGVKPEIPGKKRAPSASISKNKARLVIRNLSFKADDASLRNFLTPHGSLTDVNILKKPDGRMVGCAFVEFSKVAEATEAVHKLNGKQFLNRTVAVDWAVPKEVFNQNKKDDEDVVKEEIKEEEFVEGDVKDEVDDEKIEVEEGVKDEEMKDEDSDEDSDEGDEDSDEGDDDSDKGDEGGNESDDQENEDKVEQVKPHNLKSGHDINEGKTVFVRNLSYDTEPEDLQDLMEQYFGQVLFAKLVMDKTMGRPRGTGFVKFRRASDAAKCVETGNGDDGIFLDDRQLQVMIAQSREDVEQAQKEREGDSKEAKDSRNLYLAREGLIREGSLAASGVSESDMKRRKIVERQKKNLLKNLNMFVSSTRLCVRNLPPHVDQNKLRTIFSKQVGKNAKITEAKVMMNMIGGGEPTSKEFAFVSFEKHEDALQALRNVNNNPTIFTQDRRPIVEFSIENRKALLARQKRLEKSREKNPNIKEKTTERQKLETKNKSKVSDGSKNEFTGMTSDPKQKGLPTHSGAKVRTNKRPETKISRKTLRKQEQERKNPKLRKRKPEPVAQSMPEGPQAKKSKKEVRKEKKVSKETKKEMESEKKFNSLVNQYKKDLSHNVEIRKKWFDT